jgi:hypothetical protein
MQPIKMKKIYLVSEIKFCFLGCPAYTPVTVLTTLSQLHTGYNLQNCTVPNKNFYVVVTSCLAPEAKKWICCLLTLNYPLFFFTDPL